MCQFGETASVENLVAPPRHEKQTNSPVGHAANASFRWTIIDREDFVEKVALESRRASLEIGRPISEGLKIRLAG